MPQKKNNIFRGLAFFLVLSLIFNLILALPAVSGQPDSIESSDSGIKRSDSGIERIETREGDPKTGIRLPVEVPRAVPGSAGVPSATPSTTASTTPYVVTPSGSVEGTTSISKMIISAVTLRFLVDWGILPALIDPMEGFTRLLLLILLFALLFRLLSSFNFVGKGTAIVIALVISLMAVIFIPGSVLLAAAVSYGTLFSLLLMLVPVGLGVAAYWFLKEYPWLRVVVMLLLWWILREMENYLAAWSGSYATGSVIAGYGVVITSAAGFISFVKWFVFFVFLVNLLQALFKSSTGHSGKYSNNLKTIFKRLAETSYKNLKNKAPRAAKNLLREYVEEETELELLRDADEKVKAFENAHANINSANSIENENKKKSITRALEELKKALETAEKKMKSLDKKTWRAESWFGSLLKTLREKNDDTSELIGLENNIIKKHKECAGYLAAALKEFEKKDFKDHLKKYHGVAIKDTDYPFDLTGAAGAAAASTLTAALGKFKTTVDAVKGLLAQATTKETEAKTNLDGVIAKAEEMLAS